MALRFRDFVDLLRHENAHAPETQTVVVLSPPMEDVPGQWETLVTLRNASGEHREDYVQVEAYDGEVWRPAVTGWQMPSRPGETRQCWFIIEMDTEPTAFRVILSDRTIELGVDTLV